MRWHRCHFTIFRGVTRPVRPVFALSLLVSLCAAPARASDWSTTNLWLLHGNRFEVGASERTILRVEHADGWTYGDNYLFFDTIDSGAQIE